MWRHVTACLALGCVAYCWLHHRFRCVGTHALDADYRVHMCCLIRVTHQFDRGTLAPIPVDSDCGVNPMHGNLKLSTQDRAKDPMRREEDQSGKQWRTQVYKSNLGKLWFKSGAQYRRTNSEHNLVSQRQGIKFTEREIVKHTMEPPQQHKLGKQIKEATHNLKLGKRIRASIEEANDELRGH